MQYVFGLFLLSDQNVKSRSEFFLLQHHYLLLETQGVEATKDFCVCNALKYIYRHRNKNGVEDIKKADWYLKKYLELEKSQEEKA